MAVAPAGTPNAGDVYVTVITGNSGYNQGQVLVYNPTGTLIGSPIQVYYGGHEVAVAPAGTPNAGDIYVTNSVGNSLNLTGGTVTVIGPNNSVINPGIALGYQSGPNAVAVSPVNGDIYVSDNFGATMISPSTGALTQLGTFSNNEWSWTGNR